MKTFNFELRREIDGVFVGERFTGTEIECRRRGNEMATRLGADVECYFWNDYLKKWDKIGTYHGNYLFTNDFGTALVIRKSYRNVDIIKKGGDA